MADPVRLVERWVGAVRGAGGSALDAAAAGTDLLARWDEPWRAYHTSGHLAAVLSIVDENAAWAGAADLVRLAAWGHDVVYDPRATDNEERSANVTEGVLTGLGVPERAVAEVVRLIRLTAGHECAAGDRNGELLCDADLAILAAEPDRYDRYAAGVRREYAHVPDGAFRTGRAIVLRGLLDRPALYRIPERARAWTAPARANLTRELSGLSA